MNNNNNDNNNDNNNNDNAYNNDNTNDHSNNDNNDNDNNNDNNNDNRDGPKGRVPLQWGSTGSGASVVDIFPNQNSIKNKKFLIQTLIMCLSAKNMMNHDLVTLATQNQRCMAIFGHWEDFR